MFLKAAKSKKVRTRDKAMKIVANHKYKRKKIKYSDHGSFQLYLIRLLNLGLLLIR